MSTQTLAGQSSRTASWLRRFHPAPDAPVRLICLPHAGGSASYYFPVSSRLSPRMDVYAVQYPGRQDRRHEPCVTGIAELADRITEIVLPLADRPLSLFGHSMGAALAFEVAVRLETAGVAPADVFVSGRRAPSTLRHETTHLLPDATLISELDRLSGTDGQIFGDPELVELVLPAIRSDLRAIETYQCTTSHRIGAPIHALVGTRDPKADLEETCSWRDHTTGGFTLHTYPGGHFYLNTRAGDVMTLIEDTLHPYTQRATLRLVS